MKELSLIPKKYHFSRVQKVRDFSFLKSKYFLVFLVVIFVCLVTIGFLVYKEIVLSKESKNLNDQLQSLSQKLSPDLERTAVELEKKLDKISLLSESRIYSSQLFNLLEELTIPEVQFLKSQIDLEKAEINFEGRADDYRSLAQQINVFEKDKNIKSVITSGIELGEDGRLKFNFKINFDKDLISHNKK